MQGKQYGLLSVCMADFIGHGIMLQKVNQRLQFNSKVDVMHTDGRRHIQARRREVQDPLDIRFDKTVCS